MTAVDEVKQKTDILDVVSQYVKLTKAGKMFRGLCPFHSEKHGSFFVYPEQQTWHCFGACATGGDVFSFIMKKEGLDFSEALRLLARRAGVALPESPEAQAKGKEKDRIYEINQLTAEYYHALLTKPGAAEKAREYAKRRGLSDKTIDDFELGFSPASWEALKGHLTSIGYKEDELLRAGVLVQGDNGESHDRFRGKLMFPVRDERGRVTGFGARVLDDSLPKYINSPQTEVFDKSACLYGIHLAAPAVRKQDTAVIVEGYMDVLIAHQYGINYVVAAMGTALTEKQMALMKRYTKNVTFALDADSAGEEAMQKSAAMENVLGAEIRIMRMPVGKDPDDVIKENKEAWSKLEAEALPVLDYVFTMSVAGLNLARAKDRTLIVDKLGPVIAGMNDAVRRAGYLQKLAELVKVEARQLETIIVRSNPKPKAPAPGAPDTEVSSRIRRLMLSNPVEEYCLALLIQHPELKGSAAALFADYFEDSGNRAILGALLGGEEGEIKDRFTPEIREKIDSLRGKTLPEDNLEQKFAACILRLREKYLRNRESEKEAALTLEMESGGTAAELAKLREQGIEGSSELKKVFYEKARRRGKSHPQNGIKTD